MLFVFTQSVSLSSAFLFFPAPLNSLQSFSAFSLGMSPSSKRDGVITPGETKAEAKKLLDLHEGGGKASPKQGERFLGHQAVVGIRALSCPEFPPRPMKSRFQCLPVGRGCLFQAGILIRSLVVFPAPQPASPTPSFAGTGMNGKREALSGLCSPTPVAAEFQITPQTKPKQAAPCVPLSPLSLAFSHQAWQQRCSSVARHMQGGEDGQLCRPSLCSGV